MNQNLLIVDDEYDILMWLEDMFKQTEKIELFARKFRNLWDAWGNEVFV